MNDNTNIIIRAIGQTTVPHVDETIISGNLTPSDQHTAQKRATFELSDEQIAELKAADIVVIGVPMHNFLISSTLKAYFDLVIRTGGTFTFGASGPEVFLQGKNVIVITPRGTEPQLITQVNRLRLAPLVLFESNSTA